MWDLLAKEKFVTYSIYAQDRDLIHWRFFRATLSMQNRVRRIHVHVKSISTARGIARGPLSISVAACNLARGLMARIRLCRIDVLATSFGMLITTSTPTNVRESLATTWTVCASKAKLTTDRDPIAWRKRPANSARGITRHSCSDDKSRFLDEPPMRDKYFIHYSTLFCARVSSTLDAIRERNVLLHN